MAREHWSARIHGAGIPARPRRLRRGVYLLPSMFTVGNLFCGYLAVLQAMRGDFERSAFLILLATVLDFLDGKVARLTRSTSPFGLEFDSLADLASFGIAPAVLVHSWGLVSLGRSGWIASFVYVICSASRLARFNIQAAHADKRYFVGLPIPAAAAVLAAITFSHPVPLGDGPTAVLLAAFVVLLSGLMVGRNRYRSFKELALRRRKPYIYIVGFGLAVAAIASAPQQVLLGVCFAYLLSGLLPRSVSRMLSAPRRRQKPVQVENEGSGE
ncbi:MAG: CDP-diacylglycerol--serine O-phosphatidyltransferase [Acidobacteria bacterium]|nr:CDP-diacylglycerol--serine O-phosphatidyltransferase [Acidobacteriota bacterium]